MSHSTKRPSVFDRFSFSPQRQGLHLIILIICLLAPLGYFAYTVHLYAVNIPAWDDYDSVLNFLFDFFDAPTLKDKLTLIFSQHNEHRIVLSRILTIANYYLFGDVQFRYQILVSHVAFILLFSLLFVSFKITDFRQKLLYFLPVPFILFEPQYADGTIWTTTIVSSFYVTFFALLAFVLLEKNSANSFVGALLVLSLALFTQGNGMFVAFSGLLLLLTQKNYTRLAIWFSVSLLIIGCYFSSYQKPPGHPSIIAALQNIVGLMDYFFSFMGSSLGFSSHIPALVSGILIILHLGYLTFKKYYSTNRALYCFFIFLVLTAAANSATRSAFGVEYAIAPGRYRIISCIAVILVYLSILESAKQLQRKIICSLMLFSSLFYSYYSYAMYTGELRRFHDDRLVGGLLNWCVGRGPLAYPWADRGDPIFIRSLERGIYHIPQDKFISKEINYSPVTDSIDESRLSYGIDGVWKGRNFLVIYGWAFMKKKPSRSSTIYFTLKSPKQTRIFDPTKIGRGDIGAHFKSEDRTHSGFYGLIPLESLDPNERYEIGVFVKSRGLSRLKYTGTEFTLAHIDPKNQNLPDVNNFLACW